MNSLDDKPIKMEVTNLSFSVDSHYEVRGVVHAAFKESLRLDIPIKVEHNKTTYIVDAPAAITKTISAGIETQTGDTSKVIGPGNDDAIAAKWGAPEGYNPSTEDRETPRAPAVTITQMPEEEVAATLGAPAPEGPKTDGDKIQVPEPVSLEDLKNDFPGDVEGPVVVEMAAKKE